MSLNVQKGYLFTSESVGEGHPDKVADQISDALLDAYLAGDPNSHVAIETLVTTNRIVLAGEVTSNAHVHQEEIARQVIREIGYTRPEINFSDQTVEIHNYIHKQSNDIAMGVDRKDPEEQGAGDQGIMFGYACNQTDTYMPVAIDLSHRILRILAEVRHEGKVMTYLRPDCKSQFTVVYGENRMPHTIDTLLLSTQHDPMPGINEPGLIIGEDVKKYILPRLLDTLPVHTRELFHNGMDMKINPTGNFVIGGPDGDTGLTGRKIIVDTYGGWSRHGGGAFSGKDPSKVDRSGAYAARYIAKNLVAAGMAREMEIQLSYAIGEPDPVSIMVNTFGTADNGWTETTIAKHILENFPLRPYRIIRDLQLKKPIYRPTASYGHLGRDSYEVDGITFFPWEKLDRI
ncbi:MAG: methionine adenosyltransferase [Bacteroidota bacterium]